MLLREDVADGVVSELQSVAVLLLARFLVKAGCGPQLIQIVVCEVLRRGADEDLTLHRVVEGNRVLDLVDVADEIVFLLERLETARGRRGVEVAQATRERIVGVRRLDALPATRRVRCSNSS